MNKPTIHELEAILGEEGECPIEILPTGEVRAKERPMKIVQPFRNPNEYSCYLEGVKAIAELFGYMVDSAAFGGGIPTDLTLYRPEAKHELVMGRIVSGEDVIDLDVYAAGEETAELPTVEAVEAAETDANTEAKAE